MLRNDGFFSTYKFTKLLQEPYILLPGGKEVVWAVVW